METCPDDVFEYYDPIDEDGPIAYSTCIPRVLSLAALYEHNQYYIDNEDFYFGSDLHSFVEENGTAPGANCATVTYCSGREDLKVIHDNLDEVECGLDIVDCAQENIVLGQTCEESYIPNIGTLVFCENPFGCNFLLNYIYLIPSGIYALQSPNDTEMQLVKNQFFNDQNQHDEVSAFGYSKIGDNRIPLSIVSSPGLENNLFYDYNLHPQSVQVDKDSIPEISHFIEDWNQEYTAVIKPTNLGNELVIYKEDTLIAWNQYLDSDTQLETVGFEESSGIFIISGFFNGTLRFSGSEVAHTETQSLFVLKLSASDGEFIGVDVFEMPNNNSEIRLIEDGRIRNGAIIATAQYNNSPSGFQINNSNYSTLFDNGVALLEFKVAEEEPSIIAEISIDDEVSLINSDLSTSNQAILVFTGQGHILVGEEVLETTDDNLLIVSLNLELEVVNWNISQPLEGLHLENSDFKIDNEGNFIGGLHLPIPLQS